MLPRSIGLKHEERDEADAGSHERDTHQPLQPRYVITTRKDIILLLMLYIPAQALQPDVTSSAPIPWGCTRAPPAWTPTGACPCLLCLRHLTSAFKVGIVVISRLLFRQSRRRHMVHTYTFDVRSQPRSGHARAVWSAGHACEHLEHCHCILARV